MDLTKLNQLANKQFQTDPIVEKSASPQIPSGAGFAASAIGSAGELFGFEKPESLKRWEAEHPYQAVGASIAGTMVPYAGWYGAASKATKFAKAVDAIGAGWESGFARRAAQEMARIAPFEIGRTAFGGVFGDRDTKELAIDAATSTALAGGIGGVIGKLSDAGSAAVRSLDSIVPGLDLTAPAQLQLRKARAFAQTEEAKPFLNSLNREIDRLSVRSRAETRNSSYVKELDAGDGQVVKGHQLARLFKVNPQGQHLSSRRLLMSSQEFPDRQLIDGEIGFWELPKNYDELGQFFRVLTPKTETGTKFTLGTIKKNLNDVGDGWFMGKEKDGLFVMAKEKAGKALLFKTDTPGSFAKHLDAFKAQTEKAANWMVDDWLDSSKQSGSAVFDEALRLRRELPITSFADYTKSAPAKAISTVMEKTGIHKLADNAQVQRIGDAFRETLAPAMYQFGDSPIAKNIYSIAKLTFDKAESEATRLMYGLQKLKGSNLYSYIASGGETEGGTLKGLIDKLDPTDLEQITNLREARLPIDQIQTLGAEGKISTRVVDFMSEAKKVDDFMVGQIQSAQKAAGYKPFTPLQNHYGMPRTWEGDYRVPIKNEAGEVVYIAGGKTAKAAQTAADKIMQEAEAQGRIWKSDRVNLADRLTELDLGKGELANQFNTLQRYSPDHELASSIRTQIAKRASEPFTLNERSGMGGYIGSERALSKQELEKMMFQNLQSQHRYMAELAVQSSFKRELGILNELNPNKLGQLLQRIDDMAGRPGPLSKAQNVIADKILSPVLGKNSASKIVQTTNKLMFHMYFSGLNFAFPVTNALQFIQTVAPEVAFIRGAPRADLSKYYSFSPLAGADGAPKGFIGGLNTLKILRESFKLMGRPTEELAQMFDRGVRERVIDPKLVEEVIGENSKTVRNLRDAITSGGEFANWIGAALKYPASVSEKFARGQAFTTGYLVGKDLLSLQGDQLYRFAREFTIRTNYAYGTADRARIMTGPFGSAFGLFKNWMMHYMGSMLEYTNQAVVRGNVAPLLWQTAGTGLVGGIAATPIYGVADGISKMATDKSLLENIYNTFHDEDEWMGDGIYMGLPGLLGVSLTGSTSAPLANPIRDISQLASFAYWDRMQQISKAIGGAVDAWDATGVSPLNDHQVRNEFARAFTPKWFYRGIASWQQEGQITSLSSGYPVKKDASVGERLLFSLGFNPTDVEKIYRITDEQYTNAAEHKKAVVKLGEAWYNAQMNGDSQTLRNIMLTATANGLDLHSIIKSAQARMRAGQKDQVERVGGAGNLQNVR